MNDWLHNLPITWMALVVFGFTYLLTAGIYGFVTARKASEHMHLRRSLLGSCHHWPLFSACSSHLLLRRCGATAIGRMRQSIVKLARLELWWSSPLPFRVKLNRGCKPLSAATLSRSQLRSGR